jgi:uncharacterized protein (UPF0332 family)
MDQIKWCLNQKKGIELVEPNDNLREAYLLKADETLDVLKGTKVRDWQLTTAYYAMYHGLYSLLMKIGIKCEIHTCTIEFAKRYLDKHFTKDDFILLDKAFRARNDAQYYVNREVTNEDYQLILKKAPQFLVKCKNIILDQNEIIEIRARISSVRPV